MQSSPIRLIYKGFESHDHVDVEVGDNFLGNNVGVSFITKLCPNCSFMFKGYLNRCRYVAILDKGTSKERRVSAFDDHTMLFCHRCGWWQIRKTIDFGEYRAQWAHQYSSILANIDISGNDVMVAELRSHLVRNWNDRQYISAGKAEDLVASILKEHLSCDVYHSSANVNAADGGIDLFVGSKDGKVLTAVQVKRRINAKNESVKEVRNFVGALVLEGYRKGIFVTTAEKFTQVARDTANKPQLSRHQLELELIDGLELLELLKAQEPPTNYDLPLNLSIEGEWNNTQGDTFKLLDIFQGKKS